MRLFIAFGIWVISAIALSNTDQQVIQTLEGYLRQQVTNPKDAKGVIVHVVPISPKETARGKLQLIEIASKPAKIKSVFLREFRGRVVEPVIDVNALLKEGKLRTLSVKESVVEGTMDAQAIEQIFAEGKSTRPMNIKARITDDGRVMLTGKLTLLKIDNPFEAICRMEPRKDGLYVRIDELWINRVPAPLFLRLRLEGKINPVVERSDLPFDPEIRFVRIQSGLIHVDSKPPKEQRGQGS